jgi:hypothetical protein
MEVPVRVLKASAGASVVLGGFDNRGRLIVTCLCLLTYSYIPVHTIGNAGTQIPK